MNPLLATRALAIGHQSLLLDGISIEARPGDVLAVLGPNGGGKTTLFRTLLGLIPTLAGKVTLAGQDHRALDAKARARLMAYVPQLIAMPFAFRVREVVTMGRAVHLPLFSSPGRKDRSMADECMERLGIAHLADHPMDRLSGGEQRMVMIARALAQDTPLLVLDEPAAYLDLARQATVLDTLARLADASRAVLFSTHDPAHALNHASHALLVATRRAPLWGAIPEVLTPENLSALYGVGLALLSDSHGRPAGYRAVTAQTLDR